MIAAEVKALTTADYTALETFKPDDPEKFAVHLRAMVGPRGQDGEESFDIKVCTPSWLQEVCEKDRFANGRHTFVMNYYDAEKVRRLIVRFIERCSGETWREVAEKVARLGYWEFEDHLPSQEGDSAKSTG